MLTAKSGEDDKLKDYDFGADDCITKPFSLKVLLAKANAMLCRSSALPVETMNAGKISITLAACKAFLDGQEITLTHKKFMGYTKNAEGELVIVPEEAKIVRLIYRLYFEGKSLKQIKEQLEREGIKTVTGKDNWSEAVLTKMLTNEKYIGDALLQKTYTVDFLSKKRVVNDGIVKQYYIHDNHEAIIPKEVFYAVQREREERASKHKATIGRRRKIEVQRYSSRFMLANITV